MKLRRSPTIGHVRRIRIRRILDMPRYVRRSRARCFVCEIVAGNPDYPNHTVYRDDSAIVFFPRYPNLYGHCLVAPLQHREQVTGDFTKNEYLRLQELVHRVGEAVRAAVPCERLYVMSMGSQQANRHVHWHVAPLPPGVPLYRQQFAAFGLAAGALELAADEWEVLTSRLRSLLNTEDYHHE